MSGKKYKDLDEVLSALKEPEMSYYINYTHTGMAYTTFEKQSKKVPFKQNEWSSLLHLSERTFQRYKKENKKFESIYTEKILEIILLFKRGVQVFGSSQSFYNWLTVPCLSLGNRKPMSIIDNSFGISAVKNQLGQIEHGILG